MNKKRIYITIVILSLIFIILGSTFAYLSWQISENQKTIVTFTVSSGYSCAVDGGGNVTSDVYLVPTEVNEKNSDRYIKREVKVMPTVKTGEVYLDLWLDINELGTGLSNSNNFMYAFTTNSTSNTLGVISSGNFNGKVVGDKINLLSGKNYSATTTDTYYLWIWLDKEETSSETMNQIFNLSLNGNCADNNSSTTVILPDIDNGLIPVIFDTSGSNTNVKTIAKDDASWYNYDNKEWANAILVTDVSRNNYLNTSGVTVAESDILAYYVWIPRYKYKIWTTTSSAKGQEQEIDIVFESNETEKSTGNAVDEYLTHPAFTFGDKELNGIWVGKFETTGSTTSPTIIPDNTSIVNEIVSVYYETSKLFSNYGLSSKSDSHMIRNSEWSAVAYLSHSKYGVNREIYINNSSDFYTGRSGGEVGGSSNANKIYTDKISVLLYNKYGYYTWDGFLLEYGKNTKSTTRDLTKVASTTGNITGIYDMAGGAFEYVMGYYSKASSEWGAYSNKNSSGFTTKPDSKYYDDFITEDALTACNGICFGQRFVEANKWYGDTNDFLSARNPWLINGGGYLSGTLAGIFAYDTTDGSSDSDYGFRSVISYVG